MTLELDSLQHAITAMELVQERAENKVFMNEQDDITRNAIRSGVIQHFEFTYELCWKFMQRWIRINHIPEEASQPRARKDLFRLAAKLKLIADPKPWYEYADARNITSHTYNPEKAKIVYQVAKKFTNDAKQLLKNLKQHND